MMRGIGEGLAYAWRTPQVRLVLAMVTVVSTVGFNFHVLLPLLASDTLHAGPEVFGILSATFGAGALLGALLSATLGRASWKVLVLGTAGFSLSLLALAPQTTVLASAMLLFFTGVSFTLWTSNANAILQMGAPDRLRGRVVSLYLWAFAGLAPLGGLLAGWLVDVGGTAAQLLGCRHDLPGDDASPAPSFAAAATPPSGGGRSGSRVRRLTQPGVYTPLTCTRPIADDLRGECVDETRRSKALWVVAALLAVNAVLLVASPGLALPGCLGDYFFGPRLVRAEVLVNDNGVLHDYRIDRGTIRAKAPGSLTLRERDGSLRRSRSRRTRRSSCGRAGAVFGAAARYGRDRDPRRRRAGDRGSSHRQMTTGSTGPQLLLVEDDESIGTLVSAYLEKSGFRVAWVRSGEDALVGSTACSRAW